MNEEEFLRYIPRCDKCRGIIGVGDPVSMECERTIMCNGDIWTAPPKQYHPQCRPDLKVNCVTLATPK